MDDFCEVGWRTVMAEGYGHYSVITRKDTKILPSPDLKRAPIDRAGSHPIKRPEPAAQE